MQDALFARVHEPELHHAGCRVVHTASGRVDIYLPRYRGSSVTLLDAALLKLVCMVTTSRKDSGIVRTHERVMRLAQLEPGAIQSNIRHVVHAMRGRPATCRQVLFTVL